MATIWDADVLIWVASQIVEARDAGRPTSRLIAATPHEILAFTRRGTGKASYERLKAGLDRLQSTTIATSIGPAHDQMRVALRPSHSRSQFHNSRQDLDWVLSLRCRRTAGALNDHSVVPARLRRSKALWNFVVQGFDRLEQKHKARTQGTHNTQTQQCGNDRLPDCCRFGTLTGDREPVSGAPQAGKEKGRPKDKQCPAKAIGDKHGQSRPHLKNGPCPCDGNQERPALNGCEMRRQAQPWRSCS